MKVVDRTVLSPHQLRLLGLPTAMPSKLSTLNATAWTWIGKRKPAAIRERRTMEKNMMNECDKERKKPWVMALSMPIARCVDQDFRRGCCNGML